jgi:hypothetical protein
LQKETAIEDDAMQQYGMDIHAYRLHHANSFSNSKTKSFLTKFSLIQNFCKNATKGVMWQHGMDIHAYVIP